MKIASEKERKAAIDKAQSELDFWKGVADELAKRNGTTAENVAPQADEAEETLTADEAATDVAPTGEGTGDTTTTTTPTTDTETATATDEATTTTDEADKATTDSQGNPINADGTLKLEKIELIDELTDDDFLKPSRNVELPKLPKKVDDAIGANGKPVIIKKNIFTRNAQRHNELSADDSRKILESALYNPDLYGQNQKAKRPYNWVVINTKDKDGNNRLVLIELSPEKGNAEIVHWHYIDNRGLEKIKRQAEREGGQLLILPSKSEEAGALSSRTVDLSSEAKDTTPEEEKQETVDNTVDSDKANAQQTEAEPHIHRMAM